MAREKTKIAVVEDGLETVEGAKNFLKISRTSVYGLMESGDLPYVKIGKRRRIPRRALLDLAQRGLVTGEREMGKRDT